MGILDGARSWIGRQKSPVSLALVFSFVITAILLIATHKEGYVSLALLPDWETHPWAMLTYPWASIPVAQPTDLVWVAVEMYFIYWFGGAIEREMGSAKYAIWVAVTIVLAGVCTGLGGQIANVDWAVIGPWLPSAALVVCWCNRNRNASLRVWMVLPLPSRWLGWLIGAAVFLTYIRPSPIVGAFACLHLVVAWAYASDKLPFDFGDARPRSRAYRPTKPQEPIRMGGVTYDEKYYDDVKRREKERLEQERLKKLLGED